MQKGMWLIGALASCLASAAGVVESEKALPLVQDVDVVVIGGSSGAVAAACKAERTPSILSAGTSLFCMSHARNLSEVSCRGEISSALSR